MKLVSMLSLVLAIFVFVVGGLLRIWSTSCIMGQKGVSRREVGMPACSLKSVTHLLRLSRFCFIMNRFRLPGLVCTLCGLMALVVTVASLTLVVVGLASALTLGLKRPATERNFWLPSERLLGAGILKEDIGTSRVGQHRVDESPPVGPGCCRGSCATL
eukprot:3254315-Amphidinium_carterae.1